MLTEFGWSEWLSMMASLLLVIGMLVATLFAIKKLGPNLGNSGNRRLKLLEIQNLGGRQKLLLVSLNGDQVLIGLSPQGMTKLGSWSAVEEDNDKPKSYKLFKGIIGYNLTREDGASYYPFLIRHAGAYTVDFRPVVTFTDMYTHFKSNRIQASADQRETGFESVLYKHSLTNGYELTTAKSYYERYNRCGTTFNIGFIQDGGTHDGGWGLIKNHFYHKINHKINHNLIINVGVFLSLSSS